jgi:pimeloyl-ACP methyl ester carboxylesterase
MRSVVRTVGYPHGRAYGRRIRSVTCPVLLIHGTADRRVPIGAARAAVRANPAWSLREFGGVGHVPQLETPRDTADAVLGWLGSAGQQASQAARTAGAGMR